MKVGHLLLTILVLLITIDSLYAQKIQVIETKQPVSIRGLSVVNDKVAWLSSSSGYTAITRDGGHTWQWQQVKDFEKADFRDIEAFSDKEAIIMSSGTPALILKTTDGGANWQVKYRNDDKAYFLDAMDFSNDKHGLILGDPIDKKFLLLETNDGGDSWHKFANLPDAMEGEAAFAASGTCLRLEKSGSARFVTGGKVARYIYIDKTYKQWSYQRLPIKEGKDSQGAFSLDQSGWVFVGGDYSNDKDANGTAAWLNPTMPRLNNGFIESGQPPLGYQSCVEGLKDRTYISTGTAGSHITENNGNAWRQIDTTSFNVCREAKNGTLVLLAGDKGKIGLLTL